MPDITPTPKAQSTGLIDALQAAARYATFLVTAFIAIIGFLKVRDVAGLLAYIQSSGGEIVAAISALIALAVSGYGVFKTHKRGVQAATPAVLPSVK